MRLMHVVFRFHLGGSEQVAVQLATGMAERGHECCVVAVTRGTGCAVGEELKRRLAASGSDAMELGGHGFRRNLLSVPVQLARLWAHWQPDIVHCHTDRPDLMVSLALRLRPVRVARTIHNSMLWDSHRWTGWLSESGFRDDLVVTISQATEDAYVALRRRHGLAPSPHVLRIPNGTAVPGGLTGSERAAILAELRADPARVRFCFAGRFTHQKGFDVLLGALEQLPPSQLGKMELHAFGAGEDRAALQQRSEARNLPVLFHAPRPGISRILAAFDAVIMPSRFEGLPMVALESLMAGVPVLATAAPGLTEALPPDWRCMVPVEDPTSLARLIGSVLDDGEAARSAAARAALWARRNYGTEAMLDAYEDAYARHAAGWPVLSPT